MNVEFSVMPGHAIYCFLYMPKQSNDLPLFFLSSLLEINVMYFFSSNIFIYF